MRIDYLTCFLGFVAIIYTFVGLATFLDIPTEISDWKTQYAQATTIVGISCGVMLSLRIYNLHKKSRKLKEESNDDPRIHGRCQGCAAAEDLRQAVPSGIDGRLPILGEDLQGGWRVHGGSLQVMPRGSSLLPREEAAALHDPRDRRRPAQEAASQGAHGQPQSGRGEDLPGRGAADEDGEDGEGRDEGQDEGQEKPKGNQ